MKITKAQAKKQASKFNINLDAIPLTYITYALNVELEHGKKYGALTNITNDDIDKTTQIMLAHLIEYPDYYARLKKMEMDADNFWKDKSKNIFND
jgi:hypothetical protein